MKFIILFILTFLSFSHQVLAKKTPNLMQQPSKHLIVIDAGHGGLDLGTKARKPYCEEKRIALLTAMLAKKYLDQLGYRVILTRSTDVFIPLSYRVNKANHTCSSLFVSLHYNSSPNKKAHGIEVFYCEKKGTKAKRSKSKKLASNILKNVIRRTKARSRGVKKGNFYVIRETKMPAILIEGGFISNSNERVKLKNRSYIDRIARGIADGVDLYFKS